VTDSDRMEALKTPLEDAGCETDRARVFLMTDSFQIGGSERQFVALAQSLKKSEFHLRLGCLQRKGTFGDGFEKTPEYNLGGSFLSSRAQHARLKLARDLIAEKITVAHSFDFYSNLMLIPTARLTGVPVVIGSQRQIGDLLTPLQSLAQRIVFRLCDRVVCNSHAAAERLISRGLSLGKITIIPNGLPEAAFSETRASLPPSGGIQRVGLIARMNSPVKNHAGFLRAAAQLSHRCSKVEFLLVGDGPLRPELEALAAHLGLGSRVKFVGERQDIPGLLASMDVSVVFSHSESLSNVALESMAAGVPVVATRVGGNPEIVRDRETGLLVSPGDEEGLTGALEQLITQASLRATLGQNARKFASSNFTMDRVTRQYEKLYSDLLSEKKRRLSRRSARPICPAASSGKLRVAIVAASPRWIGGQGVQAQMLMRNWENDSDLEARFIPIDPTFPSAIRWIERIPFLRTVVRMPLYLAALWRGTQDQDIVHIFSASYWSFLLAPMPAWLVARWRKKRALIHYHSGEARDHLRRSRMAARILGKIDRVVVPSEYLVNVFREFQLRAQVVPNFVNLTDFSYRSRRPLRPRLVCTRGFHPYYSVDLVVRAFALVKKDYPEARLCLVGKGPMESQIRGLVKQLGLTEVEFAGPISHSEIGHWYDENEIFVNASWLDNMPISILEAFASGTPVVTTAPGGIRYMVEHGRTGLLCEPGDWNALGENVNRLLRDPEFALRLARNAYEELASCEWNVVREQWLDVYRSILSLQPRLEQVPQRDLPPATATDTGNHVTKRERTAV
jgi:glycosyltransferase involved in cell wall biosynthesis